MTKKTAVVICPGRGTYTSKELGYLKQHAHQHTFIQSINDCRSADKLPTISQLDSASRFLASQHLAGEHASTLIYTCALADFYDIDLDQYEIVAVTGNSLGWYLTLACASVLSSVNAYRVIQTMGSMMQDKIIGGQIIYPIVDQNWLFDHAKQVHVIDVIEKINQCPNTQVFISIHLGGYLVLAGNDAGINALLEQLKPIDDQYPMKLNKHAAFHTPLMQDSSDKGFAALNQSLFEHPHIPMVDGRGHIWQPHSTDLEYLRDYTLGHQVVQPYDFSKAIEVALKEFAPDKLILLGPGTTLGGAIGQLLIQHRWMGIDSKQAFIEQQKDNPFLLSMGHEAQRKFVVKS